MPSLPLDLERLIFELAALEDTDHGNRVRMTLVAKRVYEWIRPILYRVAIAEPFPRSKNYIRNWRSVRRIDVAQFVRHLLIMLPQESESFIIELLSTFRNVEDLAIWGAATSPKLLEGINNLPLHTFSVCLRNTTLDEAIKTCRAFRNLTHLEILGSIGSTWEDWKALVELPKLTHLSMIASRYVEGEVILNLLKCCSLRVLIGPSRIKNPINFSDPRHLVLEDEDDVGGWESSANGQTGMWELADIIVEAQKGKLFNDDSCIYARVAWMNNLNDDGRRWYREWSRGRT